MAKLDLQEATIKALYDELDSKKNIDSVDGLIDDVLVVTDPEISSDEYDELIDRAQEIVDDTPEGDIPVDDEFIGQFAQTCPLCGATFITDKILEPGATCPICMDVPKAFVMKGQLENQDTVQAKEFEDQENEEEDDNNDVNPLPDDLNISDDEEYNDNDNELNKDVASKQISGNKLQEDKSFDSAYKKGDRFQNEYGAIIELEEPDKFGRPQWRVINSSNNKKGDVLRTDSFDTLSKILKDNGYTKIDNE